MSKQAIYYLAGHDLAAIVDILQAEYELLPVADNITAASVHGVIIASASELKANSRLANANPERCLIIVASDSDLSRIPAAFSESAYTFLPRSASPGMVRQQVANAINFLQMRESAEQARKRLEWQTGIMNELNSVGIALSSERNTEKLLEIIVSKSRELTRSDAASLYLVEPDGAGGQRLRFKITQNQSLNLGYSEFTIPITFQSMAGFVAETGIPLAIDDVYQIPPEAPYSFNRKFDEETGYHTRSMLVVPMLNKNNYVIGVLQLINHKTVSTIKIDSVEAAERFVIPYPQDHVQVALSLGSQAAVALENSLLYQNIKNLFEGFVSASVTAIEQRDPTTSGHSFRVAELTVGLAELVDAADAPPFAGIKFNRDQITEIRYASLLHDFGKVGVREEVLVKAKKLYPLQFDVLRWRFDFYRRTIEQGFSQRKLQYLMEKGREEYLATLPNIEAELSEELRALDEMWQMIVKSNEPTVLAEGSFERLVSIAQKSFDTYAGETLPLLTEEEVRTLSIPKGSLNDSERRQIEQHAYYTYVFLSQIPWTEEWKNIPRIAGYHHEKLNGRGYPNGVSGAEIPIQSRMMSISDIFDALTASDRPYKKAVPVDKALNIIEFEVKNGQLDQQLFDVFLQSKVYERVLAKN